MEVLFVINMSVQLPDGTSTTLGFALSDFTSTAEKTAYAQLRDSVFEDAAKYPAVNWVTIGFMAAPTGVPITMQSGHLVTAMRGDLLWLSHVEYFKKLVGGAGDGDASIASHGFIDTQHNIRVDFENGTVWLSSI